MAPSVTVVLLNYKRPHNLIKVIHSLNNQTVRPAIYLWDNADTPLSKHYGGYKENVGTDWYVHSSRNEFCPPRWWMAAHAPTEYVMTCDDDLMPGDGKLIEDLISQMSVLDYFSIIGAFGKQLQSDVDYEHCPAAERGEFCDIILGRMMFMRTDSLQASLHGYWHAFRNDLITDDIAISSLMGGVANRRHYCSPVFNDRLVELPDDHATCREEGHFIRREEARRRWFKT